MFLFFFSIRSTSADFFGCLKDCDIKLFNDIATLAQVPVDFVEREMVAGFDGVMFEGCNLLEILVECEYQIEPTQAKRNNIKGPIPFDIRDILPAGSCPALSCAFEKIANDRRRECQGGKPAYLAIAGYMRYQAC